MLNQRRTIWQFVRNPTLHKIQVLILLLDQYWNKPGATIRVKQVWRELDRNGIEMAERTLRQILDSLVEEGYLSLTPQGREKLYSVNEELNPVEIRSQIVDMLGIRGWITPGLFASERDS